MCVETGYVSAEGRTIIPAFSSDNSRGLGEIRISYGQLGAASLVLEEAPLEECSKSRPAAPTEGSTRYSSIRFVAIKKPFLRYRGPQCRRITISVEGATADVARQIGRSVMTLWLLAGQDVHFVDDRNILTPYDARVEL